MDKCYELKQLLSAEDTLVMPDAFDPISAKRIEYAGFKIGMRRVCIGKNAYSGHAIRRLYLILYCARV